MVRAPACRSILITVCLLLGLTALGNAQSGKRKQQDPRGLTGIPNTPPASSPERRVALVIGNAAYQHTAPLKNPVNDAQDIARVLAELQFQVILKTDATLDAMADAIFAFGERLKGGGVGLLYYSGHGMQVKGENYLIPIDANVLREDDIKRKTINAKDVLDKMDEAKSHLNLVFLDACRNNPFPRSVRSVSRGLAGMNAPTGTLLVFATNPDNVAADGTGRNGAYTKHLLQYITQPGLEVGMMLRKIRTAVKEETGGQQVPWENGSIEGEFYFTGMSGAPPVPPPTSSPPTPSSSTGTQVAVESYPPQPQPPPATIVGNDKAVHQYENKGVAGKLEECKIFANQVICYIEFKSTDLSEKGIGLLKSASVMYDNKSIPHKAYEVFLVNEERRDDGLKKKIAPGGTAEGRVVFNDVASETEKISELRVHTVIHGGHGVWSGYPFKFYNINLSKQ